MRALYLIRHSLTAANERHLYCGATDLPLSDAGRAVALGRRGLLPECGQYITSGMRRADETLSLMTGHVPGAIMPGLREMDFGTFEMKGYGQLKDLPEYVRWIEGKAGCPGGEDSGQFERRVLAAGAALLRLDAASALAVCHGGTIVRQMEAWFPEAGRNFYQWQPGPAEGYLISVCDGRPAAFREV